MSKLYDITVGEAIKERLAQLEAKPKPEPKVPARQVIEHFKEAARQAMAKGYTLAEIGQIAQEAGLDVSVSTLKTYLRSRKGKKKTVAGPRRVAPKPNPMPADAVETPIETPSESAPLPAHAGFNEDN